VGGGKPEEVNWNSGWVRKLEMEDTSRNKTTRSGWKVRDRFFLRQMEVSESFSKHFFSEDKGKGKAKNS
jgi:hypothetical protein